MFREIRRKKQQISDEECMRILKETEFGSLAVLGDDGYPYNFTMHFVYDDGKIYFHSAKNGHKVDAIKRCNKVTLNVVGPGWHDDKDYWHYQSVICFGRLSIVEDPDKHYDSLLKLCNKVFTPEKTVAEMRGANAVIVYEMEIDHMTGKNIKY